MSEEAVKCKHCGRLPESVKHCFDNMCYYSFRCSCKETPLRRSYGSAEGEWESEFFKTDPSKMPKTKASDGAYLI